MFGFSEVSKDFVKGILMTRKTTLSILTGTLGYVTYTDQYRYKTITDTFASGKITGTSKENTYETTYFQRPTLEKRLNEATNSSFTNRYYLVKGEVGTGKSRILKEITRKAIVDPGSCGQGAPVYVLATQGATFADTLAQSVGFKFNEHINLKFLISCMLQIDQLPNKDGGCKLQRTLEAIEKACTNYRDTKGRAAVLIIDAVDTISADTLKKLQAKAKLWADSNICKVIFVSCDEKTDISLQENTSGWSRAAEPIYVGDLINREAVNMLCSGSVLEHEANDIIMSEEHAQKVYHLVGGRITHLLACKSDYYNGTDFGETSARFIAKERGKFVKISEYPDMWKAVMMLQKSHEKTMLLAELVQETSLDTVNTLARQDIIRLQRSRMGVLVKFQSPLTGKTIDEFTKTENAVKAYYGFRQTLFSRSFFNIVSLLILGRKPTVSEYDVLDILAGN